MDVATGRRVSRHVATLLSIALVGCAASSQDDELSPGGTDDDPGSTSGECNDCGSDTAAPLRARLLANLHAQMATHTVLFGQERFNITGVKPDGTQWLASAGAVDRSDAKDVAGDHPVVMGFDAWDLAIKPQTWSPTGAVHAEAARRVHALGGIVEMAFHMHGCAADTFNAAGNEACLCRVANDDAFARTWFLGEYAKVADAIEQQGLAGIPIIFRPLHEHTGGWFWWGEPHWSCGSGARFTGEAAFQRVFRTVVTYLRDVRGLDNLLFAYAPGGDPATYLHGYPGDEYVDILGADIYYQASPGFAEQTATYRAQLQALTQLAYKRGKVAALTEVGNTQLASEAQHTWFSEHLKPLLTSPGVEVAYAMTWENRTSGAQQFWIPYPTHPGVNDVRAFADDPAMLLMSEAPAFDVDPADGFPMCSSCRSDADGDRWGWEDAHSCRVASWCLVAEYPACRDCASDADGDGWGWEDARSCQMLASCK
jgi:mannan endo-1,4-beta-mannosidase